MEAATRADREVETDAECEALAAVREATGETSGPMERHSVRVFRIACELAEHRGLEVELMRRADLVDVSSGLVASGLPRAWLRELFAESPRDGTYREVARMVGHTLRERPLTMTRIFVR